MTNYHKHQKVWVRVTAQDEDCWVSGRVIKVNAKTIKCYNDVRETIGNYNPHNVKLAE